MGNWLNRSDLTSRIPEFIALAEARFQRDTRLVEIETLTFNAVEDYALPSRLREIIDLYHDGGSQYGRIKIVDADELAERKSRHGDQGVPRWAAIVATTGSPTLRFAPEPSGIYALRMVYSVDVDPLSGSNSSNWLLNKAPDLYLFGALAEGFGYLMDEQREMKFLQRYEAAAEAFDKDMKRRQYGGSLTPRPRSIIGEDV